MLDPEAARDVWATPFLGNCFSLASRVYSLFVLPFQQLLQLGFLMLAHKGSCAALGSALSCLLTLRPLQGSSSSPVASTVALVSTIL